MVSNTVNLLFDNSDISVLVIAVIFVSVIPLFGEIIVEYAGYFVINR